MQFVDGVTWRVSQRGLVVCDGTSQWLVEHGRSADLPELVGQASGATDLVGLLGGADTDSTLVSDLVAADILVGPARDDTGASASPKRVVFTRSGVEFTGIATVARFVHRIAMPVVLSWPGRVAIVAVLIAGVWALALGRPAGPQVSQHPWVDATLGLAVGFGCAALHELAHAVALVHFGRTPRRAGCGFYWGSLCFYVDSSDGITLPRRARIINALSGIGVDAVTTSILLVVSQLSTTVLVVAVCWRIAILGLVDMVTNGLPILEVDGHIALTDYLDEPDLSPRSREALARRLRGVKHTEQPRWLPAFGAFSLVGGVLLLVGGTWVWWLAVADLVGSLFGGNPAEILLGLYVVVPFALSIVFSTIGLLLELVTRPSGRAR